MDFLNSGALSCQLSALCFELKAYSCQLRAILLILGLYPTYVNEQAGMVRVSNRAPNVRLAS